MAWLKGTLEVGQRFWDFSGRILGSSSHPRIWMVTGVQLLAKAEVKVGWSAESQTDGKVTIPVPEPTSSIAMATFADAGTVQVAGHRGDASDATDQYNHDDERVWMAQFREVKIKYRAHRTRT
jgi:hypothetical protein